MKEQVLAAIDVVDVVGERVSLQRKGKEYVGLCPFHNDRKPSLSVSPSKQIFKCWSCGVGGDVIKFVQLDQRCDFSTALSTLASRAGIDTDRRSGARDAAVLAERERLRSLHDWARKFFVRNLREAPGGQDALAYARGRGLSDETVERFGVGFAPDSWDALTSTARRAKIEEHLLLAAGLSARSERAEGRVYDRFRNRLVFPIHDGAGRCVAFGGRTLGDDPAKYLNSPETALFSKSRILYGLDVARRAIQESRRAVVVEGYLDVVLLAQHGTDNAVATLGTALTDSHVRLLTPLADTIFMCFDSDEAGERAADRAVEVALRHKTEVRVVLLPAGEDPADVVTGRGGDEFKSLLNSALGALEFKWNRTERAYQGQGQRGRREAIGAFLQFLAQTSVSGGLKPLDLGMLVERVSNLVKLPSGSVYDHLTQARRGVERGSRLVEQADDVSDYDESLRGVSPALVSVVEEACGVALMRPEAFDGLESGLLAAGRFCRAWRNLLKILSEVRASSPSWSRSDVIERCADAAVIELVERSLRRVSAHGADEEAADAVRGRLSAELELLRLDTLDRRLRDAEGTPGERERAFDLLLDVARRQTSVLGSRQRRAPL